MNVVERDEEWRPFSEPTEELGEDPMNPGPKLPGSGGGRNRIMDTLCREAGQNLRQLPPPLLV